MDKSLMRYNEIIAETGEPTSPDTWAERFADHQHRQGKRAKLRAKLASAEARAADQSRAAATTRARLNDKTVAARRALASDPG